MIEPILNTAKCLACNAALTTEGPPGPLCARCFERYYGELMRQWQRIVYDHAVMLHIIADAADKGERPPPPGFWMAVHRITSLLDEGKVLQPPSLPAAGKPN